MENKSSFLKYVPPMGIYETLYAFWDTFGTYMGEPGTHPWSQGFPRTDQLPGGPPMLTSAPIPPDDLRYPKAWGLPDLRESIANYYRTFYGANITSDNVMVFAGGRPALIAMFLFLDAGIKVRIAETEYTPYYDMLERLERPYTLAPSNESNGFAPTVDDYVVDDGDRSFIMLSNPCNPTGITRSGDDLKTLIDTALAQGAGMLIDEAYELFHSSPVSALQYIDNIDETNIFVTGAATKGLQAPGIRIGWVVAPKQAVEILGNFSSFGMGGVSHPPQRVAVELLKEERVKLSRTAVPAYYDGQRERYGEAFEKLGLEVHSGTGGFYHWCKLTNGMTAGDLNQRLFKKGAAVLQGIDCDMARRGADSPHQPFFRFSFGPLRPESFDSDIEILGRALQ